jgi:hypothetical protein
MTVFFSESVETHSGTLEMTPGNSYYIRQVWEILFYGLCLGLKQQVNKFIERKLIIPSVMYRFKVFQILDYNTKLEINLK